ncbi:hypothetical protein IFM89_022831 [Coptis chinensis]|uniref:Uncharacterized protein n=1 Tax=Coptis chinensis TaxID=261450 RepID=A0A835GXF9_9MAGN|nr:hypothetical protein IFM89_022831 [Coptis chinensis]
MVFEAPKGAALFYLVALMNLLIVDHSASELSEKLLQATQEAEKLNHQSLVVGGLGVVAGILWGLLIGGFKDVKLGRLPEMEFTFTDCCEGTRVDPTINWNKGNYGICPKNSSSLEVDVGKNRAPASVQKLQELNNTVLVSTNTTKLTKDYFPTFRWKYGFRHLLWVHERPFTDILVKWFSLS